MKKDIKILAIETSCDETAAALIGVENNQPVILSNIVSSQIDLHAKTGGVVPEVASRAHMEAITPVVTEAIGQKPDYYSILKNEIDYIAVTAGPGLVGSLLVGFNAAKSLAYALDKPIIAVNHIEGHIYSALGGEIRNPKPCLPAGRSEILNKSKNSNDQNSKNVSSFELRVSNFPLIALTVSGGHSSLTLMQNHGKYQNIGQTLDDASGEAFDKVAKLLELGYPGGPVVSKLASEYRENLKLKISNLQSISNDKIVKNTLIENCPEGHPKGEKLKIDNSLKGIVFPRPILNDGTFNFSFSGLKTAVLQKVLNIKKERELRDEDKREICAAFEDAVVDVLTTKTIRAAEKYKPKAIILAGGVAANGQLRDTIEAKISKLSFSVKYLPAPRNLTGDNAAMIGLAAYYHIQKNKIDCWDKIKVDSNMEL